MTLNANLLHNYRGMTIKPCQVTDTIELDGPKFRFLSENLLMDYAFIKENQDKMAFAYDVYNCLLVLDADGHDGILVHSEGYDYARYAAYVPDARGMLMRHEHQLSQTPAFEPEMT